MVPSESVSRRHPLGPLVSISTRLPPSLHSTLCWDITFYERRALLTLMLLPTSHQCLQLHFCLFYFLFPPRECKFQEGKDFILFTALASASRSPCIQSSCLGPLHKRAPFTPSLPPSFPLEFTSPFCLLIFHAPY